MKRPEVEFGATTLWRARALAGWLAGSLASSPLCWALARGEGHYRGCRLGSAARRGGRQASRQPSGANLVAAAAAAGLAIDGRALAGGRLTRPAKESPPPPPQEPHPKRLDSIGRCR